MLYWFSRHIRTLTVSFNYQIYDSDTSYLLVKLVSLELYGLALPEFSLCNYKSNQYLDHKRYGIFEHYRICLCSSNRDPIPMAEYNVASVLWTSHFFLFKCSCLRRFASKLVYETCKYDHYVSHLKLPHEILVSDGWRPRYNWVHYQKSYQTLTDNYPRCFSREDSTSKCITLRKRRGISSQSQVVISLCPKAQGP